MVVWDSYLKGKEGLHLPKTLTQSREVRRAGKHPFGSLEKGADPGREFGENKSKWGDTTACSRGSRKRRGGLGGLKYYCSQKLPSAQREGTESPVQYSREAGKKRSH